MRNMFGFRIVVAKIVQIWNVVRQPTGTWWTRISAGIPYIVQSYNIFTVTSIHTTHITTILYSYSRVLLQLHQTPVLLINIMQGEQSGGTPPINIYTKKIGRDFSRFLRGVARGSNPGFVKESQCRGARLAWRNREVREWQTRKSALSQL